MVDEAKIFLQRPSNKRPPLFLIVIFFVLLIGVVWYVFVYSRMGSEDLLPTPLPQAAVPEPNANPQKVPDSKPLERIPPVTAGAGPAVLKGFSADLEGALGPRLQQLGARALSGPVKRYEQTSIDGWTEMWFIDTDALSLFCTFPENDQTWPSRLNQAEHIWSDATKNVFDDKDLQACLLCMQEAFGKAQDGKGIETEFASIWRYGGCLELQVTVRPPKPGAIKDWSFSVATRHPPRPVRK